MGCCVTSDALAGSLESCGASTVQQDTSKDEAEHFGPLDFRRELLRMSRSFQRVTHDSIAPVCQEHGVTVQQMHVLLELMQESGQTASQLSDRAGILRTNFATVCRKLEERGLLERRRSNTDKRAFELRVTDKGRTLLKNIDADIDRRYGEFFAAEPYETFDAIVLGFRALRDLAERIGR